MLVEPTDFLEKFIDHQLSKRIVNVLNWIDIYTIGDFVRYFWGDYELKIKSLKWIWGDSIIKLVGFVDYLISRWYIFSDYFASPSIVVNAYKNFLSNRTINALNKIWIISIDQFLVNINEIKFGGLARLWIKGIGEVEDLERHLKLLQNTNQQSISNSQVNNYSNIAEGLIWMRLIAFPNIFSKRTTNALSKASIEFVSDIFDKAWRISSMMIDGLWRKWYSEIDQFIRYVKNQSLPMKQEVQDMELTSIIKERRLINILNYNLITKVSHLSEYVTEAHDWGSLRYLKDEDISLLVDIHNKYNSPKVEKKMNIASTFLGNFSDIDKSIIQERILGEMSLEQMWTKFWLTRERVRQKQKDIELRIAEIWKSIIENDEHLEKNIKNIISNYWFIILPKHSYLFDFLWFSEHDFPLLFLMLSSLNGLRGEYLEKYKLYTIFSNSIQLSGDTLRDVFHFLMWRLEKNNEDLSIDDVAYEYLLDDKMDKTQQVKENNKHIKSKKEKEIKYENMKWNVYELILES